MNSDTIEFFEKLGDKIKTVRESKGLTIDDLSAQSGIRKEYLRKIEGGKAYKLMPIHLLLLSNVLKVQISKLVDFDRI